MDKIVITLLVGILVFGLQVSNSAEQEGGIVSLYLDNRDCSTGTIETRLNCLTAEIVQLKRRMDGREGRVVPLR